jgi:hypothetical protein
LSFFIALGSFQHLTAVPYQEARRRRRRRAVYKNNNKTHRPELFV